MREGSQILEGKYWKSERTEGSAGGALRAVLAAVEGYCRGADGSVTRVASAGKKSARRYSDFLGTGSLGGALWERSFWAAAELSIKKADPPIFGKWKRAVCGESGLGGCWSERFV